MKRYNYYLFILLLTIASIPELFSTHIVGGSLTYVHLGDSTYEITLKLYRDCSGGTAAFPANANITVAGYNGVAFNPNKSFSMPLGTVTPVPSNLDTCAPPPSPMPCVEEGIYTTTVTNLPASPGGYHLYYQLIARNLSLTNVNATCNCIGESFYAYIPGYDVYWHEDFTLANGTTVDNGVTSWSLTTGTVSPTSTQVNNNALEVQGANNGSVTWESQLINIAAYTAGVDVRLSLSEAGALDPGDNVSVAYSLNGGPQTPFPINGNIADDFTAALSEANGLIGTTLKIFVTFQFDAASPNSEIYRLDDVFVHSSNYFQNSNPEFDLFPPLFLCVGKTFTFDHKATDADGDSLVYEFYTPYDGDNGAGPLDPTFPGNVATFPPITFLGGYTFTNPLGGTPLNLNAATGWLTGTPSALGQYVVGVKVKEYRNGVFLSETLRDFQFNVVNCPPLSVASFSPNNICNTTTAVFTPSDTSGNDFWWDFGDPGSTTDTSDQKFPSYTFPGLGTYTVTLIANKGTYCADTAIAAVTSSSVAAAFSDDSPVCIGNAVNFTNNSTVSTNANISSWFWRFGDGDTTSQQNPSHTYTTTGVYNVSLTVTSDMGCDSMIVQTVTVSPISTANAGAGQTVCSSNPNVSLNGSVTNAVAYNWSSGGGGTFTPNNTTLNATYTPSASEIAAGIATLTLTTTGNAPCDASDSLTITIDTVPTTANAGTTQIVCGVTSTTLNANNPINGTGIWSLISGSAGITTPGSHTTTVTGLTAGSSYTFRWTVSNGVCPPSTDDVIVNVDSLPTTAAAGPDQYLCNLNSTTLAANTPSLGTGAWSIILGSPSITTPSSPTSAVTGLAPGDSVILRWTISKGVCTSTDDVTIVVNPYTTTVVPGSDQTVCSTSDVALNGSISGNTTTGIWSTNGSGNFNPTATTLNASYTFGSTDITAGAVTLYLTTTNNGLCPDMVDSLEVTIEQPASVNAGNNINICKNNPIASLNGTVSGLSTTGQWASTGDGNFASTTNLITTYTLGATDLNNDSIHIILSSTNNSTCPAIDDTLTVLITPEPMVTAAATQTVCSTDSVNLNGIVSGGSTTGVWASLGTGTFTPTDSTLNGSYLPSLADLSSGQVTLVLTSTNNGGCLEETDTIVIDFFDLPVVSAGANITTCSTDPLVPLNGTISGGTNTGRWSTQGSGSFMPHIDTLTSSYMISNQDITAGVVRLILTSTNNGPCAAIADTFELSITEQPEVTLTDTFICATMTNAVELIAEISGDTSTLYWETSGTGTFIPNATTYPAEYQPSPADLASGSVTIRLIASNNSPCSNDTATMTLLVYPAAVASFSTNKPVYFVPNDPVQFINNSVNANGYHWDYGDGNADTNIFNPIHNYSVTGQYLVTMIAENVYGCSDTTTETVIVSGRIIVPTAFTPNANGSSGGSYNERSLNNDIFFPYVEGVVEFRMLIFNRWGELIFETNDLSIGWDGYYRGQLCQQDSYVWKIDAKFNDGRDYSKKGTITLLR